MPSYHPEKSGRHQSLGKLTFGEKIAKLARRKLLTENLNGLRRKMAVPDDNTSNIKKTSLRRFERAGEGRPAFVLQPRDIEIITAVYEHRLLDSPLIMAMFPTSHRGVLLRLQKLFHHGYLDRLKGPVSNHMVYALGDRGADLVAELSGIERGQINWHKKNKEVKDLYLFHTLQVARFRATLMLALRDKPHTRILSWYKDGEIKDEVRWEAQGRKFRAPVIPDAFFILEDHGDKIAFFLEADRSTMTRERFFQKMRAYWRYYKEKTHETTLKIPRFRVLTVCKSESRKENLRAVTKEADDRKSGSGMYWFTSEERFTIEHPESVLQTIWQTPKDDAFHQLLE